jgi:hypothetical protein
MARATPHPPFPVTCRVSVRSPLEQEWGFRVDVADELDRLFEAAAIESLLNKAGIVLIRLLEGCSGGAPFQAYFASWSKLYGAHGMQSGSGSQYRRRWGMGG